MDASGEMMNGTGVAARTVVTLCTYNEAENIADLITEIRKMLPQADVLVADDSSPDGTAEIVRSLAAKDPAVHLLLRPQKEGLGKATQAAFRWALEAGYDFVINMDADFSHPPVVLPDLITAMGRADVAIGSRYIKGGGVEGWGLKRHLMSQLINLYARVMLGIPAKDTSGSYRCYRASVLKQLDFNKIRAKGYAFQEEMLYRCGRLKARMVECPIVFVDRRAGQSKISRKVAIQAACDLISLTVDRFLQRPVT